MILNAGRVVSRSEIEADIYSDRTVSTSNVVNSAICELRKKIDRPGIPSFTETRRGAGQKCEQVGLGLFAGKADGNEGRTAYEVELATIANQMRFINAQMIENRLGDDPVSVGTLNLSAATVRLQIVYSAQDHTLTAYSNGAKVGNVAIDASGIVDWKMADGDTFDVGIVGYSEKTILYAEFPSIDDFEVHVG